jgi:hypothetical protein
MANPRRNKGDIQGKYKLSDLFGLFKDYAKGDIPDSARQRQAMRNIARDVNLPTTLPTASVGLLEAQPQQIIGPTQDMQPITQPLSTQPETIEIAKDPAALRKFSRAGDLFASFGGFQEAPQELLAQATPQDLNNYNQQKLAARNRGIGEMLLMLSDALGGRDVAMRALERQKAKQPKQKNVGQIRSEILNKLMVGQKINREEFNTLVAIDPNYRDLSITNPELFDFTEESINESEESDKQPSAEELVKKYT